MTPSGRRTSTSHIPAGSRVLEGQVSKDSHVKIVRNHQVLWAGRIRRLQPAGETGGPAPAGHRERAEIATAELEDARERELESAAIAERGRIAREMHDVLAHSLSGLSLQLEGARLVAERERVSPELREMLSRSRRLASRKGGRETRANR